MNFYLTIIAVDHKQLVELTDKYFGKLPAGTKDAFATKFDPVVFTGSDKRIRFDSMDVSLYLYLFLNIVIWTMMTTMMSHRPVLISQT